MFRGFKSLAIALAIVALSARADKATIAKAMAKDLNPRNMVESPSDSV